MDWEKHMFSRRASSDGLAAMAAREISANLMIADDQLNIVYMNDAVISLLRDAETDLKKELPHFDVKTLIGTNIDVFHKNPSHQRSMLQNLSKEHQATIKIGRRTFDLLARPLKKSDGTRAGFVVEWADAFVRLQNLDFAAQVAAASRSQAVIEFNLDGTIITANENFLKTLGYSLTEIAGKHHSIFVEKSERVGADYAEFWAALNRGDYRAGE